MNADNGKISVVVIDDHPLYADSVKRVLDGHAGISVVGVAGDSETGLAMLRELTPDVCLLDVSLPGLGGLGVLTAIERDELGIRVLLISGRADSDTVYEAIARGAAGFLMKTTTAEDLRLAVERAARGELPIADEPQAALAERIREQGRADRPTLTDRELEVLTSISEGLSVNEMSKQLNLAPGTIKMHLTRLYDKLGVSERAAAVAKAMRVGLID